MVKVYAEATQYLSMMKTVEKQNITTAENIARNANRIAMAEMAVQQARLKQATTLIQLNADRETAIIKKTTDTTARYREIEAVKITAASKVAANALAQDQILENQKLNMSMRIAQNADRMSKTTDLAKLEALRIRGAQLANLQANMEVRSIQNTRRYVSAMDAIPRIQARTTESISKSTLAIVQAAADKAEVETKRLAQTSARQIAIAQRLVEREQARGVQLAIADKQAQTRALAIASATVMLPLAAVAAYGVKEFVKFDDAINKSMLLMRSSSGAMRSYIEMNSLAISNRSITSAEQIAEAYGHMSRAGYSAIETTSLLDVIQKRSVLSGQRMLETTDQQIQLMKSYGLQTNDAAKNLENMTYVSDVLTRASQISNVSMADMAKRLSEPKFAGAMRSQQKDIADAAAEILTLSNIGFGSRSPVAQANLYREIQKGFETKSSTWKAIFEGQTIYKGDKDKGLTGDLKSEAEILKMFEKRFNGLNDMKRAVLFDAMGFGKMSLSTIQALIGQSGAAVYLSEQLHKVKGAQEEAFGQRMTALINQLTAFWEHIKNAAIVIGGTLAPVLSALVWILDLVVSGFNALPRPIQWVMSLLVQLGFIMTAVGWFTKLELATKAAAFGTSLYNFALWSVFSTKRMLINLVSGSIGIIVSMTTEIWGAAIATSAWAAAMLGLNSNTLIMLGSLGLVAAAIAAVAWIGYVAHTTGDDSNRYERGSGGWSPTARKSNMLGMGIDDPLADTYNRLLGNLPIEEAQRAKRYVPGSGTIDFERNMNPIEDVEQFILDKRKKMLGQTYGFMDVLGDVLLGKGGGMQWTESKSETARLRAQERFEFLKSQGIQPGSDETMNPLGGKGPMGTFGIYHPTRMMLGGEGHNPMGADGTAVRDVHVLKEVQQMNQHLQGIHETLRKDPVHREPNPAKSSGDKQNKPIGTGRGGN